jgi:hypothetical protein
MTENTENQTNTNPLGKYYRQPQIYVTLPTKGKYYPADVYTPSETGEIPVFPMTAMDELAFKTPDSLISGQSTVDVIKSCVPNLKNPWKMTNYDTDTILLAIRVATYGEVMPMTYSVPGTTMTVEHSVNLPALLEGLAKVEIVDMATTKSGFKIKVLPLDYQTLTKVQTARFEQEKIYATMRASALDEKAKADQFAKSFKILNTINFELLIDSIVEITTPDGVTVGDKMQIQEFCKNCDTKIINEIQDELAKIRVQGQVPPLRMKATEEHIKAGAPASYEIPLTFDQSNFFG